MSTTRSAFRGKRGGGEWFLYPVGVEREISRDGKKKAR